LRDRFLCDDEQMSARPFALFLTLIIAAVTAIAAEPLALDQRLSNLQKSPPELYNFLYKMPKGADLHNHLAGAIYAENFLAEAIEEHLCLDKSAFAITACSPGKTKADAIESDNTLRDAMINSLSLRNFVSGRQSEHDHFFDTFGKMGPLSFGNLVPDVVRRAADQNESYLELMALDGGSVSALGKKVGLTGDFKATKRLLEAAGLDKYVQALITKVDDMERNRVSKLACDQHPDSAPCRLKVRYQFQVLREFPKEQVFAQVMAGFAAAAADPRIVAVNFVQAEDGYTSMHDYDLHMRMVDFAKSLYPGVHITLHAGELAPGLVPPDGLRFHIREALDIGHAERIGHGVDIMYEKDPVALLKQMRDHRILVEINLTSNDGILGIKGDDHPLPVYRKYGVPVALSTDDEGVNRSQMTEEFVRAVQTYNLSYGDLKEMVRNSIEYSFAPGESYWKDRRYKDPVGACSSGRKSATCQSYLEKNEKARLGADLEERFSTFERTAE
jgi:adenosine deaminase